MSFVRNGIKINLSVFVVFLLNADFYLCRHSSVFDGKFHMLGSSICAEKKIGLLLVSYIYSNLFDRYHVGE